MICLCKLFESIYIIVDERNFTPYRYTQGGIDWDHTYTANTYMKSVGKNCM